MENKSGLERYLSPISVWALSFGCAVGWGAFVMPGTTFLPKAGPLGATIGIFLGAIIMFIIGVNYHYLMNKYPDAGGTLTYTIKSFGYDHGFMSSWFLILVYIAIIWANATALSLISKNLFGSTFRFGFQYQVIGYDVYFGEVLLSIAAILICGFLCIYAKRMAAHIQVIAAFVLIAGVVLCAFLAFKQNNYTFIDMSPNFSPNGKKPILQISTIVALSPWAFVGFESVSNSPQGFKFPIKHVIWVLLASIITGAISYIFLIQLASEFIPEGYSNWSEYINNLDSFSGIEGIPVFYAAYRILGRFGLLVLSVATLSGIITGLIGNMVGASRLVYAMANEGILPSWFGKLNKGQSPQNALLFLMGISVVIPFFGRTAIGWIVDVNTIGATIAYTYTSAAAVAQAKKDNNKFIAVTGGLGLLFSVIFFVYFMSWAAGAMSTESYLILAAWSILGFVYFRYVFSKDTERKYGKSIIVWIVLLFLIFFTSLMWVKQATDDITEELAENISTYYEAKNVNEDAADIIATEEYLMKQLIKADNKISVNSVIQMVLILASLAIMFSVYALMSKREKETEAEKIKAIEKSKAKSIFLSNMSHDIRTPMNAIIGYINLAERDDITLKELKDYFEKIKGSSHHLLALINDVLEMSRIESGKMDLEPIPIDLKKTFDELKDMFQTQMNQKGIEYLVDASEIKQQYVYCDKNRLNRVLLNLVSNAYKFTPQGGTVKVSAWQLPSDDPEYGRYEIYVKDSGMGMSEEFAAKVFEAFERERTSTVSGIEGTGLGMSITKGIIDMMDGQISVNTAPNKGTEFVIKIRLKLQSEEEQAKLIEGSTQNNSNENVNTIDFSTKRILLADDVMINREIASKLLTKMGFMVEQAENGKEAAEKVASSQPGYYDVVLMDVQMPVMGGYEATGLIRKLDNKELANIPIIAMTANAFSEDVKNALDAGMDGHIAKPIDLIQMKKVLTEILSK